MGYLIEAWKMSQKKFHMNLKQVVSTAGDGSLENIDSINELREFYSLIDLETMDRLLGECISKDKKYKFDTRGFAFQDLVNEMGRRLGYEVENGLYRGKKNEVGFDGLWKAADGAYIIMESKTSDDYSMSIESVVGYRDKLILDHKVSKKKCSILVVYGRDDKGALRNTVKGSDDSKNIRLISANALFQLVKIFSNTQSPVVEKQINNLLLPKDYFVLDNLVELVFPETDDDIAAIDDTDEEAADFVSDADKTDTANKDQGDDSFFPAGNMKAGKFIRNTMQNLADSGYEFSEGEMETLCSENSMHDVIGMQRNMPFFKKYNPEDKKGYYINGNPRYYSKPLTFGKVTVYLNSQIYETDKEPFINWFRKTIEGNHEA